MSESESTGQIQLARHLGVFEATMIGVGAMIGAGIFVLTGIATGRAGPAALLAFALNGVVTLFTALSYAELSSSIPEAGGGYSFVKKVMPNNVAFMSGWMLWFAYVVACSLYAKGFGSYFLEFFDRYVPSLTESLIGVAGHAGAVGLLTVAVGVLFLAINIIGAHASGQAENVITLAKLAILSVFIAFGLVAVFGDTTQARTNLTPFLPMGAAGVASAMGLTFIAFEGYDLIATVSEEVKNPRETIPRAILWSLGITLIVYLSVVFVALTAVPPAEGLPTWQLLGEYGEIGIVRAAQAFMPDFGVVLVLAGGLFATLSALNATVLASSRVAFAMGRDWMLPNRLSRLHSTRKTPVVAIVVSGALFLVVALFLPLDTIGSAASLLFLLTFALVNISLLIYRRRSASLPSRGFRVPGYPVTPILGFLTCVGLALFQLVHEPSAWGLAALWIAVGLGVYAVFFARRAAIADVPKILESEELRELQRTARYRILVPLANPDRVQPLMELAVRLARDSAGEVNALHAVELPDVTPYSEAEPYVEDGRRVLGRAQRMCAARDIPFSSTLRIGRDAGEDIVQAAREMGADVVLLGYKKEADPLENSVIARVVRARPCDIAVLKSEPQALADIRHVLLPIAGRERHDRLKIRLVHALRGSGAERVSLLTVIPPGAGSVRERRARQVLDRAARLFRIKDGDLIVERSSDVASAVIDRAAEADLVLLGMREDPWLKAFFFGRLAEQIAAQVDCPVLLTKTRSPRRSLLQRWMGNAPAAD
jgi:amino acid transporter/nucleotide-binding universal stress UspA family protein